MNYGGSSDRRYFVFAGTKWPKEAQVGDTVKLSLYEFLKAKPTSMLVTITHREDCPQTIHMQGETSYSGKRHLVDIDLHKVDVFNNSVVITPSI